MILSALELPITLAFPSVAETGKVSRRKEIHRTTVPKLINAYISGTLVAVFRKGTFLKQITRACDKELRCLSRS
jgi:hypothetical protein